MGLWRRTFTAEDSILTAAEALLEEWRLQTPAVEEMLKAEAVFAGYAFSVLQAGYRDLLTFVPDK